MPADKSPLFVAWEFKPVRWLMLNALLMGTICGCPHWHCRWLTVFTVIDSQITERTKSDLIIDDTAFSALITTHVRYFVETQLYPCGVIISCFACMCLVTKRFTAGRSRVSGWVRCKLQICLSLHFVLIPSFLPLFFLPISSRPLYLPRPPPSVFVPLSGSPSLNPTRLSGEAL